MSAVRGPEFHRLCSEMLLCQVCSWALPTPPKPVFSIHPDARILLIGQAPSLRERERGKAWDDSSGLTLRRWLGMETDTFFDPSVVAVLPMGLCYPGRGRLGDLPPRRECAPLWHPKALAAMPNIRLTVYIGRHAFERYLYREAPTVTAAIQSYRRLLPSRVAIPAPSPRNRSWLVANPWFEYDALAEIQSAVQAALV